MTERAASRLLTTSVLVLQIESGQHTDPEFLTTLRADAVPFQLSDGEQRALNLQLVRGR